ncbi:MAG: aminopeptidase P N-terminal domain-containing protein, partial [Lysobacterales bacterium]
MIKTKEYIKRRQRLMEMVGDESVVIVRAAVHKIRNNDVRYPYRQDSDFMYLSGFSEPEAMIVLLPQSKSGRS